jgi:hypothetical protein
MKHSVDTGFLIVAFIALAAVWTSPGRAEAAPDPCAGVDWDAIGYRDGARGLENVFEARAAECEAPPEALDWARYDQGYADGLRFYCTAENGYRVGKLNLEYFGVCPPLQERAFLAAYRRGLRDWAVARGYDGYWVGGVVVPHYILPRKVWPHGLSHKPPRPRPLHWRDRGGDWSIAVRPAPDDARDRDRPPRQDRSMFPRTDWDWRRLWDRTPPEPPAARVDPDRRRAPAPGGREEDGGRDRDRDSDRDGRWTGDFDGPRLRPNDRTPPRSDEAWRPRPDIDPETEPPEEPLRDDVRIRRPPGGAARIRDR